MKSARNELALYKKSLGVHRFANDGKKGPQSVPWKEGHRQFKL